MSSANSDQIRALRRLQAVRAAKKAWATSKLMKGARSVYRTRKDMESIDEEHGRAVARVLHGDGE